MDKRRAQSIVEYVVLFGVLTGAALVFLAAFSVSGSGG
jgi:hypothetical protein